MNGKRSGWDGRGLWCCTAQGASSAGTGETMGSSQTGGPGVLHMHWVRGCTENALGGGQYAVGAGAGGGQINCGVPARLAGGAGHADQSKHGGLGRGTQAAEEQDRRLTAGKRPRGKSEALWLAKRGPWAGEGLGSWVECGCMRRAWQGELLFQQVGRGEGACGKKCAPLSSGARMKQGEEAHCKTCNTLCLESGQSLGGWGLRYD